MLSVKVVCAKVTSQDMWNRMDNVVHKHVDIFDKAYTNNDEEHQHEQNAEDEEEEEESEEEHETTTSIKTSHFEFHFEFGSKRPPRDSLVYANQQQEDEGENSEEDEGGCGEYEEEEEEEETKMIRYEQEEEDEEEDEDYERNYIKDTSKTVDSADLPSVTSEALQTYENIISNIYIGSATGRSMAEESMPCECKYDSELDDPTEACGDDNLCINRMMFMECIVEDCPCGRLCRNRRFQLGQYARVDVILTERKGFGLRALDDLPTNTFIMEYIGEVIPQTEFIRRTREYDAEGYSHYYFMTLKNDEIIDATKRGCLARFINHSCNPNCVTQKWVIGKKMRIGIFTNRFIEAGEELTFDYKFERYGATAQKCYCGEPNCKGYIGASDEKSNKHEDHHHYPYSSSTIIINTSDDDDESDPSDDDEDEDVNVEDGHEPSTLLHDDEEDGDVMTVRHKYQPLQDPQQVRSFVKRMLNSVGKPRLVNKLLMRLKATNPNNSVGREVLKTIVRLHGLKMLKFWLGEWKNNETIVKKVLEVLEMLPLANRNGLEDCKMFDLVDKFTDHDNEKISRLSQLLLDEWSDLKSVYRIPKRAHTVTKPILEEEEEEIEEVEEVEGGPEEEVIVEDEQQQNQPHQQPHSQIQRKQYHHHRLKGKGTLRRMMTSSENPTLKKPRYYESTREFFDPDEDYFEYFSMHMTASEMEWIVQYPPQPIIPKAPRAMLEPQPPPIATPISSTYYYPTTTTATTYYDMNTQYIDYQNYNSMYYTEGTVEDYYYAYQQQQQQQQQQVEAEMASASSSPWRSALTEEGAVYYYNIETGETQWQVPEVSTTEQQQQHQQQQQQQPSSDLIQEGEDDATNIEEERSIMTPTISTSGSIDTDDQHLNDIELKRQVGKIVTKYLSAKQQVLWKGDRTLFKDLARKVTHHIVDKEIQSGRKIKVVDTALRIKIERFIDSYGPDHVAKYNQRNS